MKRGWGHISINMQGKWVSLSIPILIKIMKFCQLTKVGSVNPDASGSRTILDQLEADIKKRLMTMERHGGMNLREEVNKRRGPGQ